MNRPTNLGTELLTLNLGGLDHKRRLSVLGESPDLEQSVNNLTSRFDSHEVAFFHAVCSSTKGKELSNQEACISLVKNLGLDQKSQSKFSDVLFLGIGGSSLGPISAIHALKHKAENKPRVHFLENPDPYEWTALIRQLNRESTLVVAIAKSGTTFETLALYKLALDWLGPKRMRTHSVAITDPNKGDLRAFADQLKIPSLPIHPGIGGRFSIFSPVGLFPMRCAGLDTDLFLKGAAAVRQYCISENGQTNILHRLAIELVRSMQSHPNHVFMPYSSPLKLFSSWFVQMWGESLGKNNMGFTPLAALGAVDQHSLLQLLKEGPNDKITWFTSVQQVHERVVIPRILETDDLEAFKRLSLLTLDQLNRIELEATKKTLASSQRPFIEFALKDLSEEPLGAYYFALSYLTAITGTLMGVNPFDQPGVEEGKIYIRESLVQASVSKRDT